MKVGALQLGCALCGAAVGILTGRLVTGGSEGSGANTARSLSRERVERPARSSAPATANGHDFAALLKLQKLGRLHDSPALRDLERLSAGQLRDFLMKLRDQPKVEDDAGNEARAQLHQAAAEELYRREGMESLRWAEALEKGSFRTKLMWHLIGEAAYQSPAKAKPWIERFVEDDGVSEIADFRWKLMSGAQSRGAEDVIELEKLFGDSFQTTSHPSIPYPEGFDYHKLFTGLPPGPDSAGNHSMYYWAETDRQAAWEGMMDAVRVHGKKGALYYGAIFAGAGGFGDDAAGKKWALGKLEEMPEELRTEAVKAIADNGTISPAIVERLVGDLPRESDRVTLVSGMISPFTSDEKLLPALRALGSESSIHAALLAAARDSGVRKEDAETNHAKRTRGQFTRLMETLDVPPDARAEVMGVLGAER